MAEEYHRMCWAADPFEIKITFNDRAAVHRAT
jgi:hypothetical protein